MNCIEIAFGLKPKIIVRVGVLVEILTLLVKDETGEGWHSPPFFFTAK